MKRYELRLQATDVVLEGWLRILNSPNHQALLQTGNPSYATETADLKKVLKNLSSDLANTRYDLEHGHNPRDRYPRPGYTEDEKGFFDQRYGEHVKELELVVRYFARQASLLRTKVLADAEPRRSFMDTMLFQWGVIKAEVAHLKTLDRRKPIDIFDDWGRKIYDRLKQLIAEFRHTVPASGGEYEPVQTEMAQTLEELRNILNITEDGRHSGSSDNECRQYRRRWDVEDQHHSNKTSTNLQNDSDAIGHQDPITASIGDCELNETLRAADSSQPSVSELHVRWRQLISEVMSLQLLESRSVQFQQRARNIYNRLKRLDAEASSITPVPGYSERIQSQIARTMKDMRKIVRATESGREEDSLAEERAQDGLTQGRSQDTQRRDDEDQNRGNKTSTTGQNESDAISYQDTINDLIHDWHLLKKEYDALKKSARVSPQFQDQARQLYERLKHTYGTFDGLAPNLQVYEKLRDQMSQAVDDLRDMSKQKGAAGVDKDEGLVLLARWNQLKAELAAFNAAPDTGKAQRYEQALPIYLGLEQFEADLAEYSRTASTQDRSDPVQAQTAQTLAEVRDALLEVDRMKSERLKNFRTQFNSSTENPQAPEYRDIGGHHDTTETIKGQQQGSSSRHQYRSPQQPARASRPSSRIRRAGPLNERERTREEQTREYDSRRRERRSNDGWRDIPHGQERYRDYNARRRDVRRNGPRRDFEDDWRNKRDDWMDSSDGETVDIRDDPQTLLVSTEDSPREALRRMRRWRQAD